jgi:hypothetical protein
MPFSELLEKAYTNRYESSNPYLQEFYLQILNCESFEQFHLDVVARLLEKKGWRESEEEFQTRCQSKPVQEALSYLCKKIEEIKQQPVSEQERKMQLSTCLDVVDRNLRHFSPFKQIYNFALLYHDETAAENNPGLPFNALGGYEITDFVTLALFSFEDLQSVNLSDSACRKTLLECAEPIIKGKFSPESANKIAINCDKLSHWLSLFPEVTQLSCWPSIEKFCINNAIKI